MSMETISWSKIDYKMVLVHCFAVHFTPIFTDMLLFVKQ